MDRYTNCFSGCPRVSEDHFWTHMARMSFKAFHIWYRIGDNTRQIGALVQRGEDALENWSGIQRYIQVTIK